MKLLRFQGNGGPSYGTLNDDGTVSQLLGDPFGDFDLSATVGEVSSLHLLPPVVPSKVIAVGLNYTDHAQESNLKPPKQPLFWLKAPTSLIPDGAKIDQPVAESPRGAIRQRQGRWRNRIVGQEHFDRVARPLGPQLGCDRLQMRRPTREVGSMPGGLDH